MEEIQVHIGKRNQAVEANLTGFLLGGGGGGAVNSVNGKTGAVVLNAEDVGALPNTTKVPTKTSELTNDGGFITKAVNNLANYYLKSETYSKEELDNKISAIPKFSIEVVSSLPTANISDTTVYLVASGNEEDNLYTEYIYVNGVWEYLGKQTVDLTGYVKRTELSIYYTKSEMEGLLNTVKKSIPTKLSQLTSDSTHRTVTDAEKTAWNAKQPAGDYVTNEALTEKGYAKQTDVNKLSEEIADLKNQVNGVTYTNLLPLAVNVDGSEYVGENGEDGYKVGYRYSTSTGTETAASGYCCTGFIPVKKGDTIRFKNITKGSAGSGSVMFFQSDRLASNRLAGPIYEQYFDDYLVDGVYTITPENCDRLLDAAVAYFVLSTGVINDDTIITINEEIVGNGNSGNDEEETVVVTEESIEILLPSYAVATVGVEFNIYHKNVIWSTKPLDCYGFKWTISSSNVDMQRLSECLRITPTTDNIGEHTLKLQVKNPITNEVIAEHTMILRIVERTAITGKNVVYMGDSLTFSRAGLYASEIQYNLSSGGIVSVGTQTGASATNQIGEVKHEGYNGATCGGFLSANVVNGYANPFYNATSKTFDFAQFVNTVGVPIHTVCLNLGANNLGNQVQGVADLQTIISKIREYSADLPIIVSLAPPTAGQDSWRSGTFTATEMRYHWRNLIKAFMEAFDNKLPNVYISTPYFNVDSDNDFPVETVTRCSRDTTQISRQNDSLHPTRIGTLKMADSYYATLLYVLAQGFVPEEPEGGYRNLNSGESGTILYAGAGSTDKCIYQVGKYLSTGTPYSLNTDAETTAFGLIEAKDGDTIYVKGVPIDVISQPTTAQTHARFGFAHNEGSQIKIVAEHKFYNNSSSHITLTCLDSATNYYSIKINNTGLTYEYVLFSLVTNEAGAKSLVITKNEPITD